MLRVTSVQREAKSSESNVIRLSTKRVQFPGIVADAQALGCHRQHLWMVLSGRRQSKALLKRYRALKRAQS